ncbi:MAG: hypothetical protein V2I82_11970 [Halieaceae bacterium]|nr:hypothetical protein [Halieaceae bacterium]
MSKLDAITPPMWIFAFTLFLIIITAGMVRSGSCDGIPADCMESAAAAHPDDSAARQVFADECARSACGGKVSALLPLSIIVFGFVIYGVWSRQGDPKAMTFLRRSQGSAAADTQASGTGAADRGSPEPAPAAPVAADHAVVVREPSAPAPSAEKKPAPASAQTNTQTNAQTNAPEKSATKAPANAPANAPTMARAATEKGDVAADKAGDQKAPKKAEVAEHDELAAPLRDFCLSVLNDEEVPTHESLGSHLEKLTGVSHDAWKPAPLADLDLLARVLATGALHGPGGSKYRRFLAKGKSAAKSSAELEERTKKDLHKHCVTALQADAQTWDIAALPAAQQALSKLKGEKSLGGLARLGKPTLVQLAAFLS